MQTELHIQNSFVTVYLYLEEGKDGKPIIQFCPLPDRKYRVLIEEAE